MSSFPEKRLFGPLQSASACPMSFYLCDFCRQLPACLFEPHPPPILVVQLFPRLAAFSGTIFFTCNNLSNASSVLPVPLAPSLLWPTNDLSFCDSVVHDTISCSLASVSRCVKSLLCPCRFYRFLTAVPTADVLPTASSTQHIPDALTFCLLLAAQPSAPDVLLITSCTPLSSRRFAYYHSTPLILRHFAYYKQLSSQPLAKSRFAAFRSRQAFPFLPRWPSTYRTPHHKKRLFPWEESRRSL